MTRRIWVSLACAGAVLAGCGDNTSTGSPQPTGPVDTPAEPTENGRPREIKLNGLNPCALVPEVDWKKFYIEKPGRADVSKVFKSAQCFYGTNVGTISVTLVITEGVDVWTRGERNADVTDSDPVEGFPALTVVGKVDRQGCWIIVDVADGQYVLADAAVTPGAESKVPEKCEYAHQLAESVMKTLVEL